MTTPTLDDLLAAAVPPTRSVRLCLRGDLMGELEESRRALDALGPSTSLAPGEDEAALRAHILTLAEQVEAASVTFTLRGLKATEWADLVADNPPRDSEAGDRVLGYNPVTLFDALVARCVIDPVMTPEQATRLMDSISAGQWDELCDAALTVTRRRKA